MAQHAIVHRFGPDVWARVESTGEHVKIELWSNIANAYRVRSAGNGIQFFQEAELEEVSPYPDQDFSRHWSRCRATGCGAPLTAELGTCEICKARICTCGRCACSPATRSKTKKAAKKTAKKAQAKAEEAQESEESEESEDSVESASSAD